MKKKIIVLAATAIIMAVGAGRVRRENHEHRGS